MRGIRNVTALCESRRVGRDLSNHGAGQARDDAVRRRHDPLLAFVPRLSEQSGRWLMIEVTGEGVAESPARGCEVVAGEGSGVGGRHDARVGD